MLTCFLAAFSWADSLLTLQNSSMVVQSASLGWSLSVSGGVGVIILTWLDVAVSLTGGGSFHFLHSLIYMVTHCFPSST